eukprot:5525311-Prymnesium_polylepis.1
MYYRLPYHRIPCSRVWGGPRSQRCPPGLWLWPLCPLAAPCSEATLALALGAARAAAPLRPAPR